MSIQEIATLVIVAGAVAYLVLRGWRRRRAASCCGEPQCPVVREALDRISRPRG